MLEPDQQAAASPPVAIVAAAPTQDLAAAARGRPGTLLAARRQDFWSDLRCSVVATCFDECRHKRLDDGSSVKDDACRQAVS